MFPHLNDAVPHSSIRFLVDALPADIQTHPFTWREALHGKYDALIVHWPEGLLRGTSLPRVVLQRLRFLALAARVSMNKTPVIWPVHDEKPLEKGPLGEVLFLVLWDALVTRRIFMYNSLRPRPHSARDVVIPHGCYSPLFPGSVDARREKIVPGRIVLFGHIRPYKGIEEFLTTMAELATSSVTGSGVTGSGVALLALTLKRPIIVQQSPTMTELAAEVGGSWVTVMPFPASAENFSAALQIACEAHRLGTPDLSQRDWGDIGERYADVLRSVSSSSPQLLLK